MVTVMLSEICESSLFILEFFELIFNIIGLCFHDVVSMEELLAQPFNFPILVLHLHKQVFLILQKSFSVFVSLLQLILPRLEQLIKIVQFTRLPAQVFLELRDKIVLLLILSQNLFVVSSLA